MDWSQLLSGVLGALAGAVAGTLGTLYVTRHAIERTAEAERASRRDAGADARRSALLSVAEELLLNSAVLGNPGLPVEGDHKIYPPIPRDAMLAALPYLHTLPDDVRALVQNANVGTLQYNTHAQQLTAWFYSHRPAGDDQKRKLSATSLEQHAKAMQSVVFDAAVGIKAYLFGPLFSAGP